MNKVQISVLLGSVALIVLLLFADTRLPEKENEPENIAGSLNSQQVDIAYYVDSLEKKLDADKQETIVRLTKELETSENKQEVFNKIANEWNKVRQPILAAYYVEQAAKESSKALDWKKAGEYYYTATRFVRPEEHPMLFAKAISSFEKVLEIEPENVDAKIKLASCYVEGSAMPMKGIGMLREIEKTDSNNVNLQLSFAFFSEKSGQWDKAIERFEKVLKLQPDFTEAYLHIADAYDRKGEKDKVIESLEKYISLIDDEAIKEEVRNYINKLKN